MIKIVTAASSNHFLSSIQFLNSILKLNCEIVYYDIGLTNEEVLELKKFNITYKKFNFIDYPSFINLNSTCAGAYAWKPIIINLESNFNGILIWSDSGNIITSLDKVLDVIEKNSIYASATKYLIKQYTHKDCLDKIGLKFSNKIMRSAAFVGFDLKNEKVKLFISKWKYYALQKEIIIPDGSNLLNHRFDQSILSLLYYEFQIKEVDNYLGFTIHNDVENSSFKTIYLLLFIIALWIIFKK